MPDKNPFYSLTCGQAMPLEHLIDSFNERFISENALTVPPFHFDGRRVHGRFGNLSFSSQFKAIRLFSNTHRILGHDTSPIVFSAANSECSNSFGALEKVPNIVSLDRLGRTVHMLNYLTFNNEEGSLFLHVHPHHLLTVKQDHGAYFEDIIRRCGLPVRRVVIGLTISPPHEAQLLVLLDRLKNYRNRGYSTAIRFDDSVDAAFVDRFKNQFLHRFSPDYLRFSIRSFQEHFGGYDGHRRKVLLLSALRQIDTQILVGKIESSEGHEHALLLKPDLVEGSWYDSHPNAIPRLEAS